MNTHKLIVKEAARIAKGRLPECSHEYPWVATPEGAGACSKCHEVEPDMKQIARLREIAEPRKHFWIKDPYGGIYRICRDCGLSTWENDREEGGYPCVAPTFTVQTLRQLLEDLGLLWDFVDWHDKHIEVMAHANCEFDMIDLRVGIELVRHASFDILTSDTLMAEAVLEYFKEVEG